jgi:RNA polymerase sigma-70 factor, ECF subfamily
MQPDWVPDEDKTLALLQAGDEEAFTRLVMGWSPAMLRLAAKFVPHRQAAEDVVQETWIAVLAGIDKFEGRSQLRTWVMSILVRRAQQAGRRERRSLPFSAVWREEHQPGVDPGRFIPDNAPAHAGSWLYPLPRWDFRPDDVAQNAELRDILEVAIGRLPRRQQQVVMLRDVWGSAPGEVSQLLGMTANYQRVLLHRARSQLRAAVESYVLAGEA